MFKRVHYVSRTVSGWHSIEMTSCFVLALCRYLDNVDGINMPQDQVWFCTFTITIMLMSSMCSMLFILNMTFERVYGILRPHKAASFNTVKRAKITIICVVIFSILYNSPHIFLSSSVARQCVPYGQAMKVVYGQFYYWLSFILQFALPFVLLLSMNCIIIHTLRTRVKFNVTISDTKTDCETKGQRKGQSQGHDKGQSSKMQNTERQIYIMLLLVTFGFLILLTPAYAFYLYQMFYDYDKSPYAFAGFYLYNSVSQKAIYTNNGINFFLYVMSGKKFRTDLVNLFKIRKTAEDPPFSSSNVSAATSIKTLSECVE